jgi:hypothetical protein
MCSRAESSDEFEEGSGSSSLLVGGYEDSGDNTGEVIEFEEGKSTWPWGSGFETKTPISSSKSSLAVGRKVYVGWKSEADGRGGMEFGAEAEGELVLETELEKVGDRGKYELEGDGALWAVPVFMEMGDKEKGWPEGNATRNMPFG